MHVQIKPAYALLPLEDIEDRNRLIPPWHVRRPELHLEELRRRIENALLHLRIREIRPHRLRIELEGRTPELLEPVPAAGDVDLFQLRLPLACKLQNHR